MTCSPSAQPVMGRPRERDLVQLAKELLEWAAKDDSINLNHFCCTRVPILPPPKLSDYARQNDDFREAYTAAKAYLGYRREQKLNNEEIHVKAYDLNAAVYDHFLKEERRDQAKFESDLKSKEDEVVDEQVKDSVDKLFSQLSSLQSARKMERSNMSAEPKS